MIEPTDYPALARTIRRGERFWHLNTGRIYVATGESTREGKVQIHRPDDGNRLVWPDYLLNPSNFERLAPAVRL